VMRNGGLRKPDAFFNVPGAERWPGRPRFLSRRFRLCRTFFQSLKNATPRRVGNSVERAIERCLANRCG
jgi:hypothetical protein